MMLAIVGLSNNSQPQGHKDFGGRRGLVESDFPKGYQQTSDSKGIVKGH